MTTDTLALPSLEEVLKPLSDMKSFIESATGADWTLFNRAKKTFLETFKKVPNSPEKQVLWKEFTQVADQARVMRKLQEEEGEFAAEMIAQALEALELELAEFKAQYYHHFLFEKVPSFKGVRDQLSSNLYQLKFLSSKADQIQALRDELSKTGMRLSIKGRLFDRLSSLGDKVFPRKKELSIENNDLFQQGLGRFSAFCEGQDEGVELLFQIRVIQSFLKELTLKKADYEQIKGLIDPLWKKATVLKQKKVALIQELAEKSEGVKKTFNESFEQMKELVAHQKDQEARHLYDALVIKLKDRQILKADFKALKFELETLSKPLFDRIKEQRELKQQELAVKATLLDEKKRLLLDKMKAHQDADEKKHALDEAIALNLKPDEMYQFKLAYFTALYEQVFDPDQLQAVYIEVKNLQDLVRQQLSVSGLELSQSMNLQEVHNDIKCLLSEILKKIG